MNYWLDKATSGLLKAGVATARLDSLVLLEDVIKKDRSWLLAHSELEISAKQHKQLDKLIDRRARHEPLAFIRGKTEFFGREFMINHDVLEPRSESETMIELLLPLAAKTKQRTRLVDVGAGSGALAITAKLELPGADVIAIDIDKKCLEVAKKNAKKYDCKILLLEGDLIDPLLPLRPLPSILLCNLPYVPDSHTINQAAMHEPKIAIFGGPDGLDLYRKLFEQIYNLKLKPTYVLTESLPPQHKALQKMAATSHYKQINEQDFIQVFKYN